MDKDTAKSIGAILSVIGFILLLFGIMNYNSLQERYEYYPYPFAPYPPSYEQEKNNYSFIIVIGIVLLTSGILVGTGTPTKSFMRVKQKKSIYCSKCGFENQYDANFCKYCGNKL